MMIFSPDIDVPVSLDRTVSIGVLASGSGTNFEAIAEAIDEGVLDAEIRVVVYNVETAFVAERARRRGIETVFVDHRAHPSREDFDRTVVEALVAHEVEWVVMAGWMRVATKTLLDAYPERILNIHPSLLPSFRGLNAVDQALTAGVKITGCTVHIVRLAVDNGPIVAQAAVPVLEDDTLETLHQRIHQAEHRLYPHAIALAARDHANDGH